MTNALLPFQRFRPASECTRLGTEKILTYAVYLLARGPVGLV